MKKSSIFIHLQVRAKSGGKKEGKRAETTLPSLPLSFRKTEEKEWERGMRKKEREQNFYGLYLSLFSHMPKKRS